MRRRSPYIYLAKARRTRHRRADLEARLSAAAECRRCGRALSSADSIRRGIGLCCLAAEYDEEKALAASCEWKLRQGLR